MLRILMTPSARYLPGEMLKNSDLRFLFVCHSVFCLSESHRGASTGNSSIPISSFRSSSSPFCSSFSSSPSSPESTHQIGSPSTGCSGSTCRSIATMAGVDKTVVDGIVPRRHEVTWWVSSAQLLVNVTSHLTHVHLTGGGAPDCSSWRSS
jgi:hypothetical protein